MLARGGLPGFCLLATDEEMEREDTAAALANLARDFVRLRTTSGCDECHQGELGHVERCWTGRFALALARIDGQRRGGRR